MDSAMHIRVRCAVVMIERLQHRFRLLRGRRIVEIGEALAAHRFLEDRELRADRAQIEWQWLFSMAVTLLACAPIHAASPIALRSTSAPSWAVIRPEAHTPELQSPMR